MRCSRKLWATPIFCFSMLAATAQQPAFVSPPRAKAIRDLKMAQLATPGLPTFYSAGAEARAIRLQEFIEQERALYRERLGVQMPDLTLAVADAADWAPLAAPLPYGMPSVAGHPPVIVMPASWETATLLHPPVEARASASLRARASKTGKSWDELMRIGADGIGAHELGHAIVDAYGIEAPTLWLHEFLASYVSDVFIYERRPQDVEANTLFWSATLDGPHNHSSLAYFEDHYFELVSKDPMTYAWYQCAFEQRVLAIHIKLGIDFLTKIKTALPKGGPKLTNEQTLEKLEAISPGWKSWAASMESGETTASANRQ
jgi:hypothetical protein